MSHSNRNPVPRPNDLAGAIAAFERLSRHAFDCDAQSATGLFLAESARLLREIQNGRIVNEDEWLETLKLAASVMYQRGSYERFSEVAN